MLFNLFLKKHAQHFMLLSKKTGMHFKNKQMAHASQTELTHSFKPFGWSKTAKEELKAHVGLLIEACIHVTCQAWWDGQCDCCSQAYLSQDYKGLSASESFRQSELSTKAKMHEWGEDTVSGGGGSQTWEQNGRQGRRENAGREGHIRTVCTGRRRKKTPTKNPHLLRYYYLNIK